MNQVSYENITVYLKWIGGVSGLCYVVGFLVLFNFHLELTSTPYFEFPGSRAFIVGLSTLFIFALCQIAYLVNGRETVIPDSLKEHSAKVSWLLVNAYKYLEIYASCLYALAFVLFITSNYLMGVFNEIPQIGRASLMCIALAFTIDYSLRLLRAQCAYKHIWLAIYFLMYLLFTVFIIFKLISSIPTPIWLTPFLMILARFPVLYLAKTYGNERADNIFLSVYNRINGSYFLYFILALGLANQYAHSYFPLIEARYGGGEPIEVQLIFFDESGITKPFNNVWLMSETSSEYIVKEDKTSNADIYRINKEAVSALVKSR